MDFNKINLKPLAEGIKNSSNFQEGYLILDLNDFLAHSEFYIYKDNDFFYIHENGALVDLITQVEAESLASNITPSLYGDGSEISVIVSPVTTNLVFRLKSDLQFIDINLYTFLNIFYLYFTQNIIYA